MSAETAAISSPVDTAGKARIAPRCDYRIPNCLTFLRAFEKELEKYYPALWRYVHHQYVLHPSSGKRAIAHRNIIALIEGPAVEPAGLATPRRRSATPTTTPPSHGPAAPLSDDERQTYLIAPAIIEDVETKLAALILDRMDSEEGADYLREHARGVGTLMLSLLEARGSPDALSAAGNICRLANVDKLHDHTRVGVPPPVTSSAWTKYCKTARELADTAGDIRDSELHQRLLSAVVRFPAAIRANAIDKIPSGTSSTELQAAIHSFLEGHHLSTALAQTLGGGTADTRAALVAEQTETSRLRARVAELERGTPRRDPPTNVGMDGKPPRAWSQEKHRPCAHWGKQGCDGRHFDQDCPAAPPVRRPEGGRGRAPAGRGGRGHDRLRGRGRGAQATLSLASATASAEKAAAPAPAPAVVAAVASPATHDFSALFASPGPAHVVLALATPGHAAAEVRPPPGLPPPRRDVYAHASLSSPSARPRGPHRPRRAARRRAGPPRRRPRARRARPRRHRRRPRPLQRPSRLLLRRHRRARVRSARRPALRPHRAAAPRRHHHHARRARLRRPHFRRLPTRHGYRR